MTHNTNRWHATVDYIGAITDQQGQDLVERAGDFVAVTIDRERDRTRVSFGVPAGTLRRATEAAHPIARELAAAGGITGAPVAMRILTDDELAAELERPLIPPLVDSTGAREILGGISQQRLSQLVDEHADFPEPIERFAGGRGVWVRAAIEAFEQRWERKPGRPRKTPDQATEQG